MNENERDILERRLAEQAIFRQVVEDKERKIRELEERVKYLGDLLSSMVIPRVQPSTDRTPRVLREVPRRWKA